MKTINFMPEATIEQRVAELKKVCATQSEETYNRTLTESEIEREKTNYVENGIRLKDLEYEAKVSADNFKAKKNVIEKAMDEQLDRVQNRSRKVLDVLYGVADNEAGSMKFYDKFGELISSRPLTPDEFNGRLFNNDGDSFNHGATIGIVPTIGYDAKDPKFDEAEIIETDNSGDEKQDQPENTEETQSKPKKPRKPSGRGKDKPE